MKIRGIHFYVALMCGAATAALATVDWSGTALLPAPSLMGLAALAFVGFLTEKLALEIRVGKNAGGGSSITFIPVLASVVLFGPSATVAYMLVTGFVAEILIKKKPPLRASFNVAQYVLSAAGAGWVFTATGGTALAATAASVASPVFVAQLGPFVAFGLVFLGANHLAVSLAIALNQQLPFGRVWRALIGSSGTNILYDLLVSPIALAAVVFYLEWWLGGLAVTLLPLLFIRHSYLTVFKLQQANRDLLKALVKAIETRDPYTSGHSLRVSDLAGRIADELRISAKKVEAIRTAALLHDVGKIEAVYASILMKPRESLKRRACDYRITRDKGSRVAHVDGVL